MFNPFHDKPSNNQVRSYITGKTAQDDINQYEKEIERILQESVSRTERTVRLLDDLGLKTSKELICQSEKLKNIEKTLDEIPSTPNKPQPSKTKSFLRRFLKKKLFCISKQYPSDEDSNSEYMPHQHLNEKIIVSSKPPVSVLTIEKPLPNHTLSEASRKAIHGTHLEELDDQIDENINVLNSQTAQLLTLIKAGFLL